MYAGPTGGHLAKGLFITQQIFMKKTPKLRKRTHWVQRGCRTSVRLSGALHKLVRMMWWESVNIFNAGLWSSPGCYYSNNRKQTFTVCIYKISSCQSYKALLSLHVQTNGLMENQWRRFKWKMFPSDSAAPLVKLDTGAAARRFALSTALLVILVMYQRWQEKDNTKQRCQTRQRQSFKKAAQVYRNGE